MIVSLTACITSEEETDVFINASVTDPDVITILTNSGISGSGSFIDQFLSYAEFLYSDIEIEIIDICIDDQAEFDATVSRLTTEITSGKGPDIFLLPTDSYTLTDSESGETVDRKAFFSDVTEAMKNRIFLPLDDYIAASEHIRMDNYPQIIMDAGKSAEGQVVMPLAYTYDLILMDKTQMVNPELSYTRLDELINCGDERLLSSLGTQFPHYWFRSLFGEIADYDSTKLLISEDDIITMKNTVSFKTKDPGIELAVYNAPPITGIVDNNMSYAVLETWYQNMDIVYPATIPNSDNGITAYIPLFTAINANSDHPEEAFKILELLYSDVVQLHATYGDYGSYIQQSYINAFVMGEAAVSVDINVAERDESKEFLGTMAEKINVVRFESELEDLLNAASYVPNFPDETYGEHVHKIYAEMQMEMAE